MKSLWLSLVVLLLGCLSYQSVQAQAVPEFDVGGIGRGNASGGGFYSTRANGGGIATIKSTAEGTANYKGFEMELLYLLTSNLTIAQSWQQSVNQKKYIGPLSKKKNYTLQFIYAF